MIKAGIIIQARCDSNRLPNKILSSFCDQDNIEFKAIEFLIAQLQKTNMLIVLATTDRDIDNPLVEFLYTKTFKNVKIFRGPCENIASRLYKCASLFDFDYFIRVTGDDLFADYSIMRSALSYSISNNYDYLFMANMIRGFDFEVVKRNALKTIIDQNKFDIEHVEHFLKTDQFVVGIYPYDQKFNFSSLNLSLTLDTAEDKNLLDIIFKQFKISDITTEAVFNFITANKWLHLINHRPMVSIYMVHKNYERYLNSALQGVFNQTFTGFEFIFVDYGSEKCDCFKILSHYLERHNNIKIFSIKNCSFIDAINYATQRCNGSYILRADADDIMFSSALENMVDYALKNSAAIVIPDHHSYFDPQNLAEIFNGEDFNLTCHALIEKKRIDHIKYLKDQTFRDGVSLINTFKNLNFKISYLKKCLFYHRHYPESMTAKNIDDLNRIDAQILDNKIL